MSDCSGHIVRWSLGKKISITFVYGLSYFHYIKRVNLMCIAHIILHSGECAVDFNDYLRIFTFPGTRTVLYYNIFPYFLLLYHKRVNESVSHIYVLDIYWNDIDPLTPWGISHGLLSKASGHGSINISNTLHLVSKNNNTMRNRVKQKLNFEMFHLLRHMWMFFTSSAFTVLPKINATANKTRKAIVFQTLYHIRMRTTVSNVLH